MVNEFGVVLRAHRMSESGGLASYASALYRALLSIQTWLVLLAHNRGWLERISSRCDGFFRVVHSLREWFRALAERGRYIGGVAPA